MALRLRIGVQVAWIHAMALLFVLAQVLPAQSPNQTHPPSSAENQKLNDAVDAAQLIADAQGETSRANKALKAWKAARAVGRVVIIETPPKRKYKGFTWPDIPFKPHAPATFPEGEEGHYLPHQTPWQFTGIDATFLATACSCAVAIVILHEGWRLDQSGQGAPPNPPPAAIAAQLSEQYTSLAVYDLNNIIKARAICTPVDDKCQKELNELEKQALTSLDQGNQLADYCAQFGITINHVDPPQPQ